ncbi:MAG: hypothetical protein HQM07_08390 [Zetaproteobacteria bacterium]|nr:hypothetical protein [Zetaproteobacteria bacterium]
MANNNPIRIFHHTARSGGTLISKCLASMKGVVLLSELHPQAMQMFNPLKQAHEWYDLVTEDESNQELSFVDAIALIHQRCIEQGLILVLRDWSHLDYLGFPWITRPAYTPAIIEALQDRFALLRFSSVRHPLDQWLSLKQLGLLDQPIQSGKLTIKKYLHGAQQFAMLSHKTGFIRYEDFTHHPQASLQQICTALEIPYDENFLTRWSNYKNITGDTVSTRGGDQITPLKRREYDQNLLKSFHQEEEYAPLLQQLGYEMTQLDANNNEMAAANINALLNEYCVKNRRVWAAFEPSEEDMQQSAILVDCLVTSIPYMIGNLVIAKYLQKERNLKIHALVPENPDQWLIHFLISFGVELVFPETPKLPDDFELDLAKLLEHKDAASLRKRVLSVEINELNIGDLIYDTYLRDTGEPTIDMPDRELLHTCQLAFAYYFHYLNILQQGNVCCAVMGHTVYLRFGIVTRLILQVGGEVFGKSPGSGPMTIRHYQNSDQSLQFTHSCDRTPFENIVSNFSPTQLQHIETYLDARGRAEIAAGEPDNYLNFMREEGKVRRYSNQEINDTLKLRNNSPTVIIMAHVFADAPHCYDSMLFDDYYTWFIETLKTAATIKKVNWIIKVHPVDGYYNTTRNAAAEAVLKIIHANPHIKLAPQDALASSFYHHVDGLITVRGTGGMEFAVHGVPILNAGCAYYTGKGFTHEPKTITDYKKAMKTFYKQRLTDEQVYRAKVSAYSYFFMIKNYCAFLPKSEFNWFMKYDAHKLLQESIHALDNADIIEHDSLYKNFTIMRNLHFKQLFDFDAFNDPAITGDHL